MRHSIPRNSCYFDYCNFEFILIFNFLVVVDSRYLQTSIVVIVIVPVDLTIYHITSLLFSG